MSYPQLSFNIYNGDVLNTIYIKTVSSDNKLVLKITTNTSGTSFTAGEPVDEHDAKDASGSLLYLKLNNLNLNDNEFSKLAFSSEGWQFKKYNNTRTVCMTPTEDVKLDTTGSINIKMDNVSISNPPEGGSAGLTVAYYRVDPITVDNMSVQTNFKVLLQKSPISHDANLHEDIEIIVPQPYILNSIEDEYVDVPNTLDFIFKPVSGGVGVKAGPNTFFEVTFIYDKAAPGYGSLTTEEEALKFNFIRKTNAEKWKVTPNQSMQNPSWFLQPPNNELIVGKGAKSTVQFAISNIITYFQAGSTLMLVAYNNIPGYKDGSFCIALEKVPHVRIKTLEVVPNPSHLSGKQVTLQVKWEAFDAGTMTLMPTYQDVTGKQSCNITISETSSITLDAYGEKLDKCGNRAVKNVTAKVLPVINSFEANPAGVYYKDFDFGMGLYWDIDTNQSVIFESSVTGIDSSKYNNVGRLTKMIQKPQMISVYPEGYKDDLYLDKKEVISAFEVIPQAHALSNAPGAIAVSPSLGFIAILNQAQNQVTIMDTIVYKPLTSPVATGKAPSGICFSPDGGLMMVANSGDSTVSVIRVNATGGIPAVSFTQLAKLQVDGAPQQVTMSADGKYLYISVDRGVLREGTLDVYKKDSSNTFSPVVSLNVGKSPRGIAVAPSGAQLFVANCNEDSISVIGVAATGAHSIVKTIANVKSKPVGIAVTPDGNIILVACSDTGSVIALNAVSPDTSPRNIIQVGASPQSVAVLPGGAYAFVTNSGDATVSMLKCWGNVKDCKLIENKIAVGKTPSSVAVSGDGGIAFVANTGSSNITVLTLAAYKDACEYANVGSYPSNIEVSPNGKKVFVWNAGGKTGAELVPQAVPSKGLYIYDAASQTVDSIMSDCCIEDCCAVSNRAYVLKSSISSIFEIDTKSINVIEEIALPVSTKGVRYPLRAAASLDDTLFVLAVCDKNYSMVIFDHSHKVLADFLLFNESQSGDMMLCALPDASKAFVGDAAGQKIWTIIKGKDGSYKVNNEPIAMDEIPSAITTMPDGSKIFVIGDNPDNVSILAIDTDSLKVTKTYLPIAPENASINGLAVSPDGKRIFATDSVCNGIRVIDPITLKFLQTISWKSGVRNPYGIGINNDASCIFTANLNMSNIGIIRQTQPSNT